MYLCGKKALFCMLRMIWQVCAPADEKHAINHCHFCGTIIQRENLSSLYRFVFSYMYNNVLFVVLFLAYITSYLIFIEHLSLLNTIDFWVRTIRYIFKIAFNAILWYRQIRFFKNYKLKKSEKSKHFD